MSISSDLSLISAMVSDLALELHGLESYDPYLGVKPLLSLANLKEVVCKFEQSLNRVLDPSQDSSTIADDDYVSSWAIMCDSCSELPAGLTTAALTGRLSHYSEKLEER